jgi:hypothetical protein
VCWHRLVAAILCAGEFITDDTHCFQAFAMIHQIERDGGKTRSTLHGKRVLELGSGTGAVGIAASLIGMCLFGSDFVDSWFSGAAVTFSDVPALLPLIEVNCRKNGIMNPAIVPLTWYVRPPQDRWVAREI